MSDPDFASASGRADTGAGRLDSWKEIAAYLGRSVTTVRRWETLEGLPVRRLPHAKKDSVFAFRHELDAWRMARAAANPDSALDLADPQDDRPTPSAIRLSRTFLWAIGGLVVAITAVLGITQALGRGAPRSPARVPDRAALVPTPLANDEGSETSPSLSPEGDEVVYAWVRNGARDLYIKPVAGGPARRLATGDVKRPGYPDWSPRGDLIAFLSQEEGDRRGLYVVSPSGESLRRLTSASGVDLCWTSDGKGVGFVDRNSTGEPFSIYVASLETGLRQRLTTPPAGAFGDTNCAFSPDGRRLAVARYFSIHQSDVCVVGLQNGENGAVVRLTFDQLGMSGIAWAPDGRSIVFGSHNGLWEVSASGETRDNPVRVGGISAARPGRPSRVQAVCGVTRAASPISSTSVT